MDLKIEGSQAIFKKICDSKIERIPISIGSLQFMKNEASEFYFQLCKI
jgi:Zn finger protein HypA/HybF involved in hydrogenase expression